MVPKPCYEFPQLNESISLIKAKASVSAQGIVHVGDAEVRLDLLPDAGVHVYVSLTAGHPFVGIGEIKLALDGNDVPGFATKLSSSSSGGATLKWCPNVEPLIGRGNQNTQITSVVFHIFNYRDILFGTRRSGEHVGTTWHAIYHIDLKASGWNVELKSLPTTSDILKTLDEEGGYGLTYVGCLQKEDGTSFDGKTAQEMLNALRHFFSFSKGMWCNPCLAVGFDDKENRVWESWASPDGGWSNPSSWFDPHHCEQLVNLFPGFMAKWKDEDWREALHEVIYLYLCSNISSRGIDNGIILAQAAIERLSFEYVVNHKRLIESEGFKNLRASDKFRLLFSSLGIPIDIPASMPKLNKLAKQFNWIDAPHAITEIRNSLVHPEHKRRGKFGEAFYPAWDLGQWYLELALLKICDYSGTYGNRLVQRYVGEIESVPWDNVKVK
jgi:hypothetical protein